MASFVAGLSGVWVIDEQLFFLARTTECRRLYAKPSLYQLVGDWMAVT